MENGLTRNFIKLKPKHFYPTFCAASVFGFFAIVSVLFCFLYFDIFTFPSAFVFPPSSLFLADNRTEDVRNGSFSVLRSEVLPSRSEGNENETSGFQETEVLVVAEEHSTDSDKSVAGKERGICDFSMGSWVWDESYPLYQSMNCPFIDFGFRCQQNGRPDSDYVKWRWQPSGCDLPRFNATYFLEKIRNDRVVFVGDSIGRNHWESLVCMLAEAIPDKKRIYEVNGNPITKHKGFLSFKFEDYNCTIEYYRSPFLVYQGRPPTGAPPNVSLTVKIDTMDYSNKLWCNAGILVFNTGHWWNFEKTLKMGCYFQEQNAVIMNMDIETAFVRSMQTWAKWVQANVDPMRTRVFFRSYAPVHFSNGAWNTGGQCHMESQPLFNLTNYQDPDGRSVKRDVFAQLNENKIFQILNITYLSEFRKDGHSSIYYQGKEKAPSLMHRQDCSHWCLPGVPDTWNHLLYGYMFSHWNGL